MPDKNFELALQFLFPSEGGYSNHKRDRGGATNMGITQSTYSVYLEKNGLSYKDVKFITKDEAAKIYYKDYWLTSGANKVSDPKIAIALFDTAVLHGPARAKSFYAQSGNDFDKFLEIRKQSYNKIVANDPTQKIFYNGWNNRVNNLKNYVAKIEEKTTPLKAGIEMTVDNEGNRIFTAEEIGEMSPEEFRKNEKAIDEQLKGMGVPRDFQAKQAVQAGDMVLVAPYKREDGTEVKGYYRSR